MIWFFTRGQAQVDIEVRRVPVSGSYELIVDYPDGSEGVERFSDPKQLVKRTLSVQRRLINDGWMPTSPAGARAMVRPPVPSLRARHRQRLRRVLAYVHRSVSERLAATFGL